MAHLWSKSKVDRFQEKLPIAPACTQYDPKPLCPGGLKVLPFGMGESDRFCLVSWNSPAGNLQENGTSNKAPSCILGSTSSSKEKRPLWGEQQQKELKEKLQNLKFNKDEVVRRRKKHMQRNRQAAIMKRSAALEAAKENSDLQQTAAVAQPIFPVSKHVTIEESAVVEQLGSETGIPLKVPDMAADHEKEKKSCRIHMVNRLSREHSEKMELASKLNEKCVEINHLRSKLSNLEDKLSCMEGDVLKLEDDLEDEKCKGQDSNLALVDLRKEVHQLWCTIEKEKKGKENAERLVAELRTEISGLHYQTSSRAVTLSENLAQVTKSKEEAEELLKVLEDSSRMFSEALEERSSELESLKTHVEAELEVRKTSESRLSQLQSQLELMRHEGDEAQRACDIAMVQNREYVEKLDRLRGQYETALADVESASTREKEDMQRALDSVTMQNQEHVEKLSNLQGQFETALANVDLAAREKEDMQRALDAVKMQNQEHVEKLSNLQGQFETALANVDLATREKEDMQRALDESLVHDRKQVERFDDLQYQYATALAEIESMKCAQANRDTELVNIRKQHSEEASDVKNELEEKCKEINQLQASLGISAGLLGSACRQARSLQDELCCQRALKDRADLEARQLADRLGELQQEMTIPKQRGVVASTTTVPKATDIRDRIKKENMELKKQAIEAENRPHNFISDLQKTSQLDQPAIMEISGVSRAAE